MKKLVFIFALIFALPAHAAPARVGLRAPDFTAADTDGRTQTLSAYRGKIVVLEWTNPACPYVGKHYGTGNMQALQKQATGQGVIWLSIASSAPGLEGNMTTGEANAYVAKVDAHATARILDPDGTLGRLYGATATPHMFVIDKSGMLVYAGAIDDMPTTRVETVKIAHNYVRAALDDLQAGRPVATTVTQAYGCSVKYKDGE